MLFVEKTLDFTEFVDNPYCRVSYSQIINKDG